MDENERQKHVQWAKYLIDNPTLTDKVFDETFEKYESNVRSYCRKYPVVFDEARNAELFFQYSDTEHTNANKLLKDTKEDES